MGVGPFCEKLKLIRNLKLKLNENGIFVFFRFNEKKEVIKRQTIILIFLFIYERIKI